jgi:asparagine N-glycosylation enzyme membrane subunit Stt3
LFLAILNFFVPFVILLSAQIKKEKGRIVWIAAFLLGTRFYDLYWLIMPNFENKSGFYFHWLNLVVPVAMGGFWLALFCRNLQGQPLLPLYAPLTTAVLEPAHE